MKLEKERKSKSILYLLLIIFVLVFSLFAYINLNKPLILKKYEVKFEVSDKLGFDLNNTALCFGRTFPGSQVKKELNIQNTYDFPIELSLLASDNLVSLVYMDNDIIIYPNENKPFNIYLYVPKNYSFGNYSGEVVLKFEKYTG